MSRIHKRLAKSLVFTRCPLIFNFSTLKRVVKGQCSWRPLRESIYTTPAKVKGKCIKDTAHNRKKHTTSFQSTIRTYAGPGPFGISFRSETDTIPSSRL